MPNDLHLGTIDLPDGLRQAVRVALALGCTVRVELRGTQASEQYITVIAERPAPPVRRARPVSADMTLGMAVAS